jgi:arginase family enzyme
VAIIGVPFDSHYSGEITDTKAPDKIREQLFNLSKPDRTLKIVDFGNIKPGRNQKACILALRDVVGYLVEKNAVVLVIGGSQDFTAGICDAFREKKFFSLSVVDAVLDVKHGIEAFSSSNFLTRIFKNNPNLFQFSLLGYQRHLVVDELFEKTAGIGRHIRLGILREKFIEVSPVLRNSDVLSFDIGAIKYSDAPGNRQKNPNGLRSEEACGLARYAGLSERLKAFGIFETIENDENEITTRLTAEIIWYFLDGISYRQSETEWSADNKVVYKVAINELESPLVFYYEPATNRWWVEINSVTGETQVVACSENEYQKASNNEISEFWLGYIQKMDDLPK